MIAWLKRLFHHHEWETVSTQTYQVTTQGLSQGQMKRYVCRCKICGELESKEIWC